jgi:hypothetical protein
MRVLCVAMLMIVAFGPGQLGAFSELVAVVNPVGKGFCWGDKEVVFLRVRSTLLLTNVGRETVSINKDDLHVDYIIVAETAKDMVLNHYELQISQTPIQDSSVKYGKTAAYRFLTLKPGGSGHLEISFSIPVSNASGEIRGTILPGKHMVVLGISGWLGSDELAGETQQQLPSLGLIDTSTVRSRPIELLVDKPTIVQHCN